jgi:hypothetical protein
MPFDPSIFEAEVALRLIPTERLPLTAQEALEAGFEGPNVLRMAIMEPVEGWEIDQILPRMLMDLGCHSIHARDAAFRLARSRAERILETCEDPLESVMYFHSLMLAADHPEELIALGYFDDNNFGATPAQMRLSAFGELQKFLSLTV